MTCRQWGAAAAVVLLSCVGLASGAFAQPADAGPSLRARHVTVAGGVSWTGGYPIGDVTAQLRGNAVGSSAPPFTLFRAESSIEAAAGAEARVGFAMSRSLTLEIGVSYQRPGLTTSLSQDAEVAAVTIDAERLSQYVVDIGALWQLPRVTLGRRARPFLLAGGGYLRQLYDERTLVETGSVYYAGGGVRFWLRGGDGQRRSVGLRADGRALWRVEGVEFAGQTRVAPVFALHMFMEF